jgi:hypothetical protein
MTSARYAFWTACQPASSPLCLRSAQSEPPESTYSGRSLARRQAPAEGDSSRGKTSGLAAARRHGFFRNASAAKSGYSAMSAASTPLVQPNPTCSPYSPPRPTPAPASGGRATSYFSASTPRAA